MFTIALPVLRFWVLLLLIPAAAVGCRGGEDRVPTFPARGQMYFNSQPAAGAVVILRPKTASAEPSPAEWPSGYPRANVQSDGSFAVGTYEASDGAPAGEYLVLVQWPTSTADEETATADGELDDRLQGRYLDPAQSQLSAVIKTEPNDLGRFDLK